MHIKSVLMAGLAGFATASPLEVRQLDIVMKEFGRRGCRHILFAQSRGTTGVGNMGTVSPQTSDGLKQAFGASAVATEGIDYTALATPNLLSGATDARSKNLLKEILTSMAQKCPDFIIVSSGFSQGAAVNHRAIEELPDAIQDRIAGVVLYSDTQHQQDHGQINNFPVEKIKIICQPGDVVCMGSLVILPAHLTYPTRVGEAVEFLAAKIHGAQAKIKARNVKRGADKAAAGVVARAKMIVMDLIV